MLFSIIIPTFQNYKYFKNTIESIEENSSYKHEIIAHVNGADPVTENFLLTKASMEWFWEQLRSQADDDINPRFNLLKQDRPNLMGTSTLSITAGFDPLCDEGNKYADLLKESGNEVRKLHFPDLFHGFVNLTNLRTAEKGALTIFDKIRSYL